MVVALNALEERLAHPPRARSRPTSRPAAPAQQGMAELEDAARRTLAKGERTAVWKNLRIQLAYNLIPHIDVFTDNDYTKEEMKMYHETRKIMHSDIAVSATCVRVPGDAGPLGKHLGGNGASRFPRPKRHATPSRRPRVSCCMDAPGDKVYPMPLFAAGRNPVYVGRIRTRPHLRPTASRSGASSDQSRRRVRRSMPCPVSSKR